MFSSSSANYDFLTDKEAASVDAALLTSRDKFVTRVAIYSLRVLKQIAQQEEVAIAQIASQQIEDWVQQDETLKQNQTAGLETDEGFITFFTRLVLSSLKPLNQIAEEADVSLENVSPDHVIQWFEQKAKQRLAQDPS